MCVNGEINQPGITSLVVTWRLDTVEYMDPSFVKQIRKAAKELKEDTYVMGEIMMGLAISWFKGECLDAAMNYRLRDLLLSFSC